MREILNRRLLTTGIGLALLLTFPSQSYALNVFCTKILGLIQVQTKKDRARTDELYQFRKNYREELAADVPLHNPGSNIEKVAFIEALLIRETEKTPFPYHLNMKNREDLVRMATKWNLREGLSLPLLYDLVDGFYLTTSIVESPEDLLQRRWQTEKLTQRLYNVIEDNHLSSVSEKPSVKTMLKRLIKIPLRLLFYKLPKFDLTRSETLKAEIDSTAEDLTEGKVEEAFAKFANRHKTLAHTEYYLKWFRQITVITFWTYFLGFQIDQKIYPLDALWTTQDAAIQKIELKAEDEYQRRFGLPMSPQLREQNKSKLEQIPLRTLLYMERKPD